MAKTSCLLVERKDDKDNDDNENGDGDNDDKDNKKSANVVDGDGFDYCTNSKSSHASTLFVSVFNGTSARVTV